MITSAEPVGVQSESFKEFFDRKAKELNDAKWVYGLYGAMDGLSTSFSMIKYLFDVYYTNIGSSSSSSSDALHNWSITPVGIAFMTLESVALIGCSVIGNTVDDDGYYLHLMSVDEASALNHVNCFIWDGNQLVYIYPNATGIVFSGAGDVVNLKQIEKIKSKISQPERSLHLSTKQANDLLISVGGPFTMAPPTPSFTGSIASYWPYARDVMKAMKNTYKGIRNTFVLTDLLVIGRDYHYLAAPVGLVLGVLAAYNRTWLRKIRDERKDAKKLNIELLKSLLDDLLQNNQTLSLADFDLLRNQMAKKHEQIQVKIRPPSHSQFFWLYAQLSGAFSGLIDSPYLYFGALSLTVAAATSLFFIFVTTASFIFAATCIATRVYEEHLFQRELLASQLEVELTMSLLEIQLLRDNQRAIDEALCVVGISEREQEVLIAKRAELACTLDDKWSKCQLIQKQFVNQSTFSLGYVLMSGLKNGLDTYGALASFMFLIATISLVVLVPYSQFLVLGFVTLGLAGLIIFPAIELIKHFYPEEKNTLENMPRSQKKVSTLEFFSSIEQDIEKRPPVEVKIAVPIVYDGVLEIVRGGCSGGGKGIRGVEQVMAVCQELGTDGHYHDVDSMLIFAWIDALLFALTFGLRGYARLGRGVTVTGTPEKEKKTDDEPASSSMSLSSPSGANKSVEERPDEIVKNPSDQPFSPMTVSHNLSRDQICQLTFFRPPVDQSSQQTNLDPVFEADKAQDLKTDHYTS